MYIVSSFCVNGGCVLKGPVHIYVFVCVCGCFPLFYSETFACCGLCLERRVTRGGNGRENSRTAGRKSARWEGCGCKGGPCRRPPLW